MSVIAGSLSFLCPGCTIPLRAETPGTLHCPSCRWRGEAFGFNPKPMLVETPEDALPDDTTCLHHPTKKAVAVCAGTGDYVCKLCAVEINHQTYSTAYLDGAGKGMAGKAFERVLPRPDSQILLYILLHFVPYVNFVFALFAFLWVPHSIFLYRRTLQMRREDPLMLRVVSVVRLVVLPILVSLFALGWVAGIIGFVVFVVLQMRR